MKESNDQYAELPSFIKVLLPEGQSLQIDRQENMDQSLIEYLTSKIKSFDYQRYSFVDQSSGREIDPNEFVGLLLVSTVKVIERVREMHQGECQSEPETQATLRNILIKVHNKKFETADLVQLYNITHLSNENMALLVKCAGIKVLVQLLEESVDTQHKLYCIMVLFELSSKFQFYNSLTNDGVLETTARLVTTTADPKIKLYAIRTVSYLLTNYQNDEEQESSSDSEESFESAIVGSLSPRGWHVSNQTAQMHPAKRIAPKFSWLFLSSVSVLRNLANLKRNEDLWMLPKNFTANEANRRFDNNYHEEFNKPKPDIQAVIIRSFLTEYTLIIMYLLLYSLFMLVLPILLPHILEYISDTTQPAYIGYIYAITVSMSVVMSILFYYQSQWECMKLSILVRSSLMSVIFRKALSLNLRDLRRDTVINLFASETFLYGDRIVGTLIGYAAPMVTLGSLILLWFQIHWLSFSLVILVFGIFFFQWFGESIRKHSSRLQIYTDNRIKYSTELVSYIRAVKTFVWETPLINRICKARQKEAHGVSLIHLNSYFMVIVSNCLPNISVVLIVLLYTTVEGHSLTATSLSVILTILNLVRVPYQWVNITILGRSYNAASLEKIQSFLLLPEKINYVIKGGKPDIAISIKDCNLRWNEKDNFSLSDINIKIKKGQRVMLIGTIGCGKTTLLMALLDETPLVSGTIKVNGRIAYTSQKAWVFGGTIRENILLGEKYNKKWYEKVVGAVALWKDINEVWQNDELFRISDSGDNISGGQKQRIALARSLYSNKDIYLLDDPTSGLDNYVSKFVFHSAIQKLLKKKTVLLTMNTIKYTKYASQIITLENGKIPCGGQGTFNQLLHSSSYFQSLVLKFIECEGDEEENSLVSQGHKQIGRRRSFDIGALKKLNPDDDAKRNKEKEEERFRGFVQVHIWLFYFANMSLLSKILLFLIYSSLLATRLGSTWWLSMWEASIINNYSVPYNTSNALNENFGYSNTYWSLSYSGFLLAEFVIYILLSFAAFYWISSGGTKIYSDLIRKLANAEVTFYDTMPIGNILACLSEDITQIDFVLTPFVLACFLKGIYMLCSLLVISYVSWVLLLIIIPIFIVCFFIQLFYCKGKFEIQRLEAESRGPILHLLSSALASLESIRAYNLIEHFTHECHSKIDFNKTDKYADLYTNIWFGVTLDLIGALYVLIVLIGIMMTRNELFGSPPESFFELASVTIPSLGILAQLIGSFHTSLAFTLIKGSVIERLYQFNIISQETEREFSNQTEPPLEWPQNGEINIKNLCFGYDKDFMILKNISLDIPAGAKIGLVGRTGAGKTSFFQILLKLVEPQLGTILIDGIDYSTIPLDILRSRISTIVQQPVLIKGTLRYNLDPLGLVSDNTLWNVLTEVGLKDYVSSLEGKLDTQCDKGNFTVGQSQLLALARVSLRKNRILLLDEPTASVDLHTDLTIQHIIRQMFSNCTVITIAHRLATVMDSNKIIVLQNGVVVEYDTPTILLKNKQGIFRQMVNDTGPTTASYLYKLAARKIELNSLLKMDINKPKSDKYNINHLSVDIDQRDELELDSLKGYRKGKETDDITGDYHSLDQ